MSTTNQLINCGAISLAAFFYGLITVSGQYFADRGFSLYEISLLLIFAPLVLLPSIFWKREFRISRPQLPFFIHFGFVGAMLQLTQFAGIVLGVPVAIVALLLYTQPIWTTFLGKWLLQEKITKAKILAGTLALLGMIALVNPFDSRLHLNLAGVVAALMAGLFLSLWVILGRKSGLREQHFVTTTFGYSLFSSCWLIVLYPVVSLFLKDPTFVYLSFGKYVEYWWAVLFFSVFVNITPHFLAFFGMKRVDASTAGILLLFEPVSAALVAYLLFGQSLTTNIWIGGFLILSGNFLLVRETAKIRTSPSAMTNASLKKQNMQI
ncbi:EamA family transporter [bacterium]|nr:EamA family transporter [bacterium]